MQVKLFEGKREKRIMVTHGMGEVEQFCDRAVLLHKGKQIDIGRSQEIVKQYYLLDQESEKIFPEEPTVFNKGRR